MATRDNTIVLVSGGLDSFIASSLAPEAIRVFVNFGQPYWKEEFQTVQALYLKNGLGLRTITVEGLPGPTEINIPARNLFFATIAVRFGTKILVAAVRDELSLDKGRIAFARMSDLLTTITGENVEVFSNILRYTKQEAVKAYLDAGLDPEKLLQTFSCYFPRNGKPCLDCECCFRRWNALTCNGLKPPKVTDRIIDTYGIKKLQNIAKLTSRG